MYIDDLINELNNIKINEGNVIVCTYDSVLENYREFCCLECVDDEYIDENGEIKFNKILLL